MRFTNCFICTQDALLPRDIIVRGDRIVGVCGRGAGPSADDSPVVDCGGGVVAPGFIDCQLNGGWSVDFSDPAITTAGILKVLDRLPVHGVTAVCATLISSTREQYARVVPLLRALHAAGSPPGSARLLGVHFEGPFIAPARKGAHALSTLAEPSDGLTSLTSLFGISDADLASGFVRIVTLAPELTGALPAVRGLAARGVVASIGHTTADGAAAEAALAAGACMVRRGRVT
jgi:N-acetylglucosamine-6-phosphate deacetylase